jgi:hypothetical protein
MKTKLFKAALLTWLTAVFFGTVRGQTPAATPAAAPPPIIQPKVIEDPSTRAGWRRYQFGDGPSFSVIMPGQPTASAERASETAVVYLYLVTHDGAIYAAALLRSLGRDMESATETERQSFFRNFIEGFAKGFHESVKKNNPDYELKMADPIKVTAAARNAFQQDMTVGSFQGSAQLVFAGSGAFCVVSFWNAQTAPADREAFFKSFKLTGTPK